MTDKTYIKRAASSRQARGRRGLFGISAAEIDKGLIATIFVLVVGVIGALGYLVYAVVARPVAPRTDLERRLYYYEQGVKAEPKRSDLWESYAAALIDAGQYSKAADVIKSGIRLADQKSGLLVQRAHLERVQGSDRAALATADEAIKAVADQRERYAKEAAAKGLGAPLAASPDIADAEIIKAEIYADQGKDQQAVEAYTRALKEQPRMADVLAARGGLKLKTGDREGAKKDFQESLRFDPQNAQALAGLKELGEAKQ